MCDETQSKEASLNERLAKGTDALQDTVGFVLVGMTREGFLAKAPKQVFQCVLPMLHAAFGSTASIRELSRAEDLNVRDCYPICRGLVETVINVCFILARGEDAANQAMSHSFQKSYRDAGRDAGPLAAYLPEIDLPRPEEIPGLIESLRTFSTSAGRENTKWTQESIDERIHIIESVFGREAYLSLYASRFMVYRYASEIIHGTFHGALYFLGATVFGKPPARPEDMLRVKRMHETTIFGAILYCQVGLLHCLSQYLKQIEPERNSESLSKVARFTLDTVFAGRSDVILD